MTIPWCLRRRLSDATATERHFDCCHLLSELDENKNGPQFEFDWMGRLVKRADANGNETLFGYDFEGRQATITDARGFVTTIAYDDIGRVTETETPGT